MATTTTATAVDRMEVVEEVMVNTTVHLHTVIEIKISTKEISCIEDIDSHDEEKKLLYSKISKKKK